MDTKLYKIFTGFHLAVSRDAPVGMHWFNNGGFRVNNVISSWYTVDHLCRLPVMEMLFFALSVYA